MLDLEAALGEVLLGGEPEVPAAPATVRAVAALERAGDLPLDELRRYAFADPAVAAALLGAANAVPGAERVASLPDAEARLGAVEFVRLVRAVARRVPSPGEGPLEEARRRAWRSAVVSAMLCRDLARARGVSPEEAYAAGLLHDVGRIAALAAFERLAAGTRAAAGAPLRRWERLADRWHVALGAAFAERHRLPRGILDVIALHHDEALAGRPSPLLGVVRSVDSLMAGIVGGIDPRAAVEAAGLGDAEAVRLARTVERVEEHVFALEDRLDGPAAPHGAGAQRPVLREPKGEGVRLRLAGREYVAVGFAPHQLLVAGPAPLGEGALLEVEVLDRRRAPFHARVLTAWSEGARFGAILLPLGLSGPSLAELGGSLPAGADA
jgi:HD-like signal output (HDOD) protein